MSLWSPSLEGRPGPALRALPAPGAEASRPLSLRRLSELPTATVLLALVATLCAVGLVMVGSASPLVSDSLYGSPYALLAREVLWMALGGLALFATARLDYRRWRRFSGLMVAVTFVGLVAVLAPGIGVSSNGSSRWLGAGEVRLQPSELMKLALVLFGAHLVARQSARATRTRRIVGPVVTLAVAAAGLILLQPDMGTALVLACITLALLFGGGVPVRRMVEMLAALAFLAVVVGLLDPYRRARLLSFLNPSAHQAGSGYQVLQSLIGLGSGHLVGLGLGAGHAKWGVLPNAHTDFIFSVIGEELGLFGTLFVLVVLGALAWFGLRAAARAPDRYGALVALALVAWISSEAVINMGAVVGLLPVTGIPLPFISFGGSSLLITMAAAGILINVARQERPEPVAVPAPARKPLAGRGRRR
jgi:cell division protein FtsW